jgi:fructose-1,6-bisphosphatase
MTIHEEYAQDLIDTDPLDVIANMDHDQIAGTIRAMYWANELGDMVSVNIFAKSLTNAFFEKAMDITEKKLQENNVYQGPFDEMYDMGHSHGDFI